MKGRADEGSVDARSERLGRSTPDPHSAEKDSQILIQVESKDRGPGVRQSSEAPPERTSNDSQDGVDAYGLVRSERSRGECLHSSYTTICVDRY